MSRPNVYFVPQPQAGQTTQQQPRVRKEGFIVPSQQLTSSPSVFESYGERSSMPIPGSVSTRSNAFSHLRQYTSSQSSSQATSLAASSSSSYRAPSAFNQHQGSSDIQEALSSLVDYNSLDEVSTFPLSSARKSDSTATLRGLDDPSDHHNYPYACSAPVPIALGASHNLSFSQHHSYDDSYQYQSLLLNHSNPSSLDMQALSPETDPSSVFSQSEQSNSYFDQIPYHFDNDPDQSPFFDNSSFGAISPSTSLSTSFSNHIDLSKLSPSVQTNAPLQPATVSRTTRSRSRSQARNPVVGQGGGGGKALSSRSRAVRKDSIEAGAGRPSVLGTSGRGRRMSGGKVLETAISSGAGGKVGGFSTSLPAPPTTRRVNLISSTRAAEDDGAMDTWEDGEVDTLSELSGAALAAEKKRLKKISHNDVERRRREHINESIADLAALIPPSILDPQGSYENAKDIPLGQLGEKLGVDMTDLLGIDADAEEEEGDAQPAGKGQKKGGKKAKSMRLSASGGNALGPDGKPNKGLVLSKSVDFIKYLQQIIQAQADRTATLEDSLQELLISRSPLAGTLSLPRPPDPSPSQSNGNGFHPVHYQLSYPP